MPKPSQIWTSATASVSAVLSSPVFTEISVTAAEIKISVIQEEAWQKLYCTELIKLSIEEGFTDKAVDQS